MRFVLNVDDVDYICIVTYYSPPCPMRITGTGFGDADPPEDEEFEFFLQDYHGRIQEQLITPEVEAAALAAFKKANNLE